MDQSIIGIRLFSTNPLSSIKLSVNKYAHLQILNVLDEKLLFRVIIILYHR